MFIRFVGTHAEYDDIDAQKVCSMSIRPIRTRRDHAQALKEIERLWNAKPGALHLKLGIPAESLIVPGRAG